VATIASVSRERKNQLKLLLLSSRKLDAKQEMLEREIKRLVNRKRSVPEVADATRLAEMTLGVADAVQAMANVIEQVSRSWGSG